jgi:hypothetical protein
MGSFAFAFAFHGVVGVVLARGTTSCLRTNDGAGGDEALAKDLVKKDSDDARYDGSFEGIANRGWCTACGKEIMRLCMKMADILVGVLNPRSCLVGCSCLGPRPGG